MRMLLSFLFLAVSALASAQTASTVKQEHTESLRAIIAELEQRIATLEQQKRASVVAQEPHRSRRLGNHGDMSSESSAEETPPSIQAPSSESVAISGLTASLAEVTTCLDHMWLLLCGALVMFMQAGFAMLETGAVRSINAGVVLMKNVTDACLGAIVWWILGYGLAYGLGDNPNEFSGTQSFAGSEFLETGEEDAITGTNHFRDWFFQWAFCATAATIVSGAVAERINFLVYMLYTTIMTGFIYPVVVYWTWSGAGFLNNAEGQKWQVYSDFAGSGIVHMTGGIAALVGALMVGPRPGRWNPDRAAEFAPHNITLVVLGTFVLWFGWYGFNCGSTLAFSDSGTATQAALVAMNTTLSAAGGGLMAFLLCLIKAKVSTGAIKLDLGGMCNGILAGLVAVCAGVGDVEPGWALFIGMAGGLFMFGGSNLVKKLGIDDPLDAFAVHYCGGIIGLILRPLLDRTGVNGDMFGTHLLGAAVISAWSGGITLLCFLPFRLSGRLNVSDKKLNEGCDVDEVATGNAYQMSPPLSPKEGQSA